MAGIEESDKWFEAFVNSGIVNLATIKLAKYGIVDHGIFGCNIYNSANPGVSQTPVNRC